MPGHIYGSSKSKFHFTSNALLALFYYSLIWGGCFNRQDKPTAYQVTSTEENVAAEKQNISNDIADFESKERLAWQKPDFIIQQFGDLTNKTIADLGAGTGFFSFRIVPKAKKVIALDIDQRFLTFMDSLKIELPNNLRSRFETRLVSENDANLKPHEVDAVLVVNTYMYIRNRVEYLKNLKKGISKSGSLLIVDYKDKNLPVGPPSDIKVSLLTVENELKAAGFKRIFSDDTTLEYQYIVKAISE